MKISLVPKKKRRIIKLKNEFAKELGLSLKNITSKSKKKQRGSIGGKMVDRMVEKYKKLF